ncbi:MAG: hypothetical protein NVS2B17_04140 [Candidatus Velthaea sp.]
MGSPSDQVLSGVRQSIGALDGMHTTLTAYFGRHAADYEPAQDLFIASVLSSLLTAIANLDAEQITAAIFATLAQVKDMQQQIDALDQAAKNLEANEQRIEDAVKFLSAGMKIAGSLAKGDVVAAAQTASGALS